MMKVDIIKYDDLKFTREVVEKEKIFESWDDADIHCYQLCQTEPQFPNVYYLFVILEETT
ncbi:hypothetical protein [Scytonema sp. NUACC26]|uniref:hypothetical protein n=1 Tax=Scytonema sp. NUACC26 TaxID=3140176 RepID=UPI0034DB85C1